MIKNKGYYYFFYTLNIFCSSQFMLNLIKQFNGKKDTKTFNNKLYLL